MIFDLVYTWDTQRRSVMWSRICEVYTQREREEGFPRYLCSNRLNRTMSITIMCSSWRNAVCVFKLIKCTQDSSRKVHLRKTIVSENDMWCKKDWSGKLNDKWNEDWFSIFYESVHMNEGSSNFFTIKCTKYSAPFGTTLWLT